jgi:5'(3')-deoxyribonucleotidase
MKKKVLLIDMDCILVDMMPYWLSEYSRRSGESIRLKDLDTYWLRTVVEKPEIIDEILHEEGFFLDKPLMPGAREYFQKLIEDDRFDVVVLTQPPRRADHSVREKRIWMEERFSDFEQTNMMFGHRKELVAPSGDLIFDDCPDHLIACKKANPEIITATITYPYNEDVKVDKRFDDRVTAWEDFFNFVKSLK